MAGSLQSTVDTHHENRMNASRRGFTLVELLVAIAIIAVLLLIMLPAMQAVREAARKTTCRNNLRQIGLGLANYHTDHRKFPPFLINRKGNPQRISDEDKGANWLVHLLPYLEQGSLYDEWDRRIPANENPGRSTEVALFKCPSDSNSTENFCNYAGGEWARGNYGMNVSPCSFNASSGDSGARSRLGGFGGVNYSTRMASFKDGTSHTVAVDELRAGLNPEDIRGSWAMPGLSAGTSALFGDAGTPNARGGNADDMENCEAAGLAGDSSRGMGCFESKSTAQMAARSAHRGGVHVLMVDGSVRFVHDDVESKAEKDKCGSGPLGVWQAIHTRAGGEHIGEF